MLDPDDFRGLPSTRDEHPGPERGDAPDFSNDGLIRTAQWVALAAAVLLVPVGFLLASAIAQSHTWPDVHVQPGSDYGWVAGHGSGVALLGGIVAVGFAVVVFTLARMMPSHPRGVARAFVVLAAIFAAFAVLVLGRPTALLGTVPIAGGIRGMSDMRVAGLGFLVAAGLLAVAGGLHDARAPAQGGGAARGGAVPPGGLSGRSLRSGSVLGFGLVLESSRGVRVAGRPMPAGLGGFTLGGARCSPVPPWSARQRAVLQPPGRGSARWRCRRHSV